MNTKKLTAQQLAAALREIAASVEAEDSFEGYIKYESMIDEKAFNVEAFWRVGNSEGQGGCRMIGAFGS